MQKLTYTSNQKKAKVILPGSKSVSNRLLLIAAVGNFLPNFKNLSKCDDVQTLFNILHSTTNQFNVNDSGTALRFIIAYFSGIMGEWHITGSERIQQRPVKPLVDKLKEAGAHIIYDKKEGYAPLTITGTKMKGETIEINISQSSQYASALLLIAPMFENGLKLILTGEKRSMPYIDLTIELMEHFGIKIVRMNDEIAIMPGQQYEQKPFEVEADWSASAFWYEMAALIPGFSVKILGLNPQSKQGDKAVTELWKKLNVDTHIGTNHVTLTNKPVPKNGIYTADIGQTPDLFPPLAMTCIGLKKPFEITGTANLALKESDRAIAIQNIAHQMGAEMIIEKDKITCTNYMNPKNDKIEVDTINDHRIAMAAAPIAALTSEIYLNDPSVISKSYPEYWNDIAKIGFRFSN
jgi:3-phosphoshikimate 1-carboxyvinyltransferase